MIRFGLLTAISALAFDGGATSVPGGMHIHFGRYIPIVREEKVSAMESTVLPSSPGSPPPGQAYSNAVPKSPGIPTPGWIAAGLVPKSPGSPPPDTAEPDVVPMSPGASPQSYGRLPALNATSFSRRG